MDLDREHRKILGKPSSKDLASAVGLAAHGIGAGALVYLRRVFEDILEQHRQALEATTGQPIAGYQSMKVEERIEALRDSLPPLLVENRKVYGIMSKGIHALDEDTCRALFPAVKEAIFMIVQQDAERAARAAAEAALKDRLDKLAEKIRD